MERETYMYESARNNYADALDLVARRLRNAAEEVETVARHTRQRRPDQHLETGLLGRSRVLVELESVQHDVLNMLPNLGLSNLISAALDLQGAAQQLVACTTDKGE